jgi:hypothetical protein
MDTMFGSGRLIEKNISLCCRLVLGATLLFSGFTHFQLPYLFLEDLLAYELVSGWTAVWVSILLPSVEIALAVCLFSKASPKWSLVFTLIVLILFLIAQSSALIRGLKIDCGCFGGVIRNEIGPNSILILIFLIGVGIAGLQTLRSKSTSVELNHA